MSELSHTNENNNNSYKEKQKVSQYSEIIIKLVEKLVSKDVSVTYTFDNLEIDIPSSTWSRWKGIWRCKMGDR